MHVSLQVHNPASLHHHPLRVYIPHRIPNPRAIIPHRRTQEVNFDLTIFHRKLLHQHHRLPISIGNRTTKHLERRLLWHDRRLHRVWNENNQAYCASDRFLQHQRSPIALLCQLRVYIASCANIAEFKLSISCKSALMRLIERLCVVFQSLLMRIPYVPD
jgi:hypothetical protein